MGKVCAVPYRDIQEEAPKAHCESCGGELYGYEKVYHHAGEALCRMVTRNEDRGLGKVDFVTARTKGGIGCVWQKG